MKMTMLMGIVFALLAERTFASEAGTLLGTFETNKHQLQLIVGDTGTLYNVLNLQGELLASAIDGNQLTTQWPGLAELIETGVADDASLSWQHQQQPADKSGLIESPF